MARETKVDTARALARSVLEMRNLLRLQVQLMLKDHRMEISFELLEVLAVLYRRDGINQQEIAAALVRDKSSMTYLIDALVERKLVARVGNKEDKRHKQVFLTRTGKAMQKKIDPWVNDFYTYATTGISAAAITQAFMLVQQMNDQLKQQLYENDVDPR